MNNAFLGGLLKGFGNAQAVQAQRAFEAEQADKAQKLSILQAAATNPNLDPSALPGLFQQMQEIYTPGKAGGKRSGGKPSAQTAASRTSSQPSTQSLSPQPSSQSPSQPPSPPGFLSRLGSLGSGIGHRLQAGVQGANQALAGSQQPPAPPINFLTPEQRAQSLANTTGIQTQAGFDLKQNELDKVIKSAQAQFPGDVLRQQEYIAAIVPGYKAIADHLISQSGKIDAKDLNPGDINLTTGQPVGPNPPPGIYVRSLDPQTGRSYVQRQSEQTSAAMITLQDKQRYQGLLMARNLGKPISPEDQAWMSAYKEAATMVSVEGAKAREQLYLESRVYGVLDRDTNQLMMASARDIAANPSRYAPASQEVAANNRLALVQSLHDQSQQVRADLQQLPQTFSKTFMAQMAIASKAAADGDAGMLQSVIQGAVRSDMTEPEQAYVIDLSQLAEDAMSLRQILGAGGVSNLVRSAILNVIPSASTPDRGYATRQLDQLDAVIQRVSRGIPSTTLPQPPASLGGGGKSGASGASGTSGSASPKATKGLLTPQDIQEIIKHARSSAGSKGGH